MSAALDAEQQAAGWTMVPNSIVRNSGLGVYEKAVLLALMSHSEGWAITVDELRQEADISESSCRRALAKLRERNLIQVEEQHGRIGQLASIYTVTLGNQVPVPQTVSEHIAPVIPLPVPQTVTPDGLSDSQETVPETSTLRKKDHANEEQKKRAPRIEPSEDALRLCTLLADLIEKNVGERPKVGPGWAVDMDRLLRIDGRSPEQVEKAIRWCQGDSFWFKNILSPAKLRTRYLQLRAAAQESAGSGPRRARPGATATRTAPDGRVFQGD